MRCAKDIFSALNNHTLAGLGRFSFFFLKNSFIDKEWNNGYNVMKHVFTSTKEAILWSWWGGGGFMQPFKLTHNSRRAVIRQTGNGVWPGNRGSNSTSSVLNDKLRYALRSLNDSVYQYGVYSSKCIICKWQWLATAIFFQICRRLKYITLMLSWIIVWIY